MEKQEKNNQSSTIIDMTDIINNNEDVTINIDIAQDFDFAFFRPL